MNSFVRMTSSTGIYLMHNGECVAENTFFQARELRQVANGLQCLLANGDNIATSPKGKWLYPDGNPMNCSKIVNNNNRIGCTNTTNNDGVILYTFRIATTLPPEHVGVYTCCLPGNCSDGSSSSNSIMVRIFGQSLLIFQICFLYILTSFSNILSIQMIKPSLTFMSLYQKM